MRLTLETKNRLWRIEVGGLRAMRIWQARLLRWQTGWRFLSRPVAMTYRGPRDIMRA